MKIDLKTIANPSKSSIGLYIITAISLFLSLWSLRQVVEIADQNDVLARAILDLHVTTRSNDDALSKQLPALLSSVERINALNSKISDLTVQNKKLQDDLVAQYVIISQRIDESLPNYVK